MVSILSGAGWVDIGVAVGTDTLGDSFGVWIR